MRKALGIGYFQVNDRNRIRSVNARQAARRKEWVEKSRRAIESSNAYVEKYGLPLAKYRMF